MIKSIYKTFSTYLIGIILYTLILSSCSHSESKTINKKTTTPKQTLRNDKLTHTPNKFYTQLPFAGNVADNKDLKALPLFDSVNYIPLNTNFDFNFKNGDVLKHLKAFNHQLPNLNKYQVYYVEFNCDITQDSVLTTICNDFVGLSCGFLIFYDSSIKHAQIINVYNSYYIDSGIDMSFIIDKDYKIHLTETEMTDGDVEPDEPMISESYPLSEYLIEVDTTGGIVVMKIR